MSTLSERLLEILERDNGVPKVPEVPQESPTSARYAIGTVFCRQGSSINAGDHAGILVLTSERECKLICLPGANRWSDSHTFVVPEGFYGPTVYEFHKAFGKTWIATIRGRNTLEEWARDDV